MKHRSIVAPITNSVNQANTPSTRVRWLLALALLVVSSVILIGITSLAQEDNFTKTAAAVAQVRKEIEGMTLQEAKNTIIKRLGNLPVLSSADVGSIQGYDLSFRMVTAYGGVVRIKDRFTERSVLIKGDAQADEVMKIITQLKFDPIMSLTQAVRIIRGENFAKLGLVYADLGDEIFSGKRYNLQFCLDEKHGSLTIIRDTWAQQKVALNTSADADQVMKMMSELKFDGLTLTQAQDLIKAKNFNKVGVVYSDLGDRILDGERYNLRFPIGETPKTACAF